MIVNQEKSVKHLNVLEWDQ